MLEQKNRCGKIGVERISLRDGFDLCFSHYSVPEDIVVASVDDSSAIGFGFCLSGEIEGTLAGVDQRIITKGGQSQIFTFPNRVGSVTDKKGSYRRLAGVQVEPQILYDLLDGGLDDIPASLRSFTEGGPQHFCSLQGHTLPVMSQLFEQLISCCYTGITRKLFFESKALDMIVLGLHQVGDKKEDAPRKREVDKIHAAAELLRNNLDEPPTLTQLSRSVGVSHVKLNRGFRHLFDTTVFGYLRQVRLERARYLLETEGFDVTVVALSVGYNSLSAFSRAFYQAFGCNPGVTKRKAC